MGAAGTRERIIARNQYNPGNSRKAYRESRVVGRNGATQTKKKKGDIIICENGRVETVRQNGWC